MAENGALFHEEIQLRTRKYIFEVKESAAGSKYITIREERQAKGGIRYDQIMVFDDHAAEFFNALEKVKRQM